MLALIGQHYLNNRVYPAQIFTAGSTREPLGFLTHQKYSLILQLPSGLRFLVNGLSLEDAVDRMNALKSQRCATGFHLWN